MVPLTSFSPPRGRCPPVFALVLAVLLLLLPGSALHPGASEAAPLSLALSSRLDLNHDAPSELNRVDAWFDGFAEGGWWLAHARLRVIGESDTESKVATLDQRSLTLDAGAVEATGGTFYAIVGRGLVFRAHEQRFASLARTSRALNLDRDVDGVRAIISTEALDFLAFAGKPTLTPANGSRQTANPLFGERVDPVRVLSADVNLLEGHFQAGGALVEAERRSLQRGNAPPPDQTLRSIRGGYRNRWLSTYVEWADLRWHGSTKEPGRGLYAQSVLTTRGWGISFEVKDYERFSFPYHDLPTLVRTHSSVLLNASTHVQKPQQERGFQTELVRAHSPWVTTTANVSAAWNDDLFGRDYRYWEIFLEHRHEGDAWTWGLFGDWAEDTFTGDDNRWTGGASAERHLADGRHSIFSDLELQRVELTPIIEGEALAPVTNGFVQVGLSRAGLGSLALNHQWTSRQDFEDFRTRWWSGTFTLQLGREFNLSLFAGSRPGGLICSGGFCSFTPEFEGVEARVLSAF